MILNICRVDDQLSHVSLAGAMNLAGVDKIKESFIENTSARKKSCLVDLSEVTFVGSIGLRLLLSCAKNLAADGKKMICVNPQPIVREVMEVAGIITLIAIAPSVDEGICLIEEN